MMLTAPEIMRMYFMAKRLPPRTESVRIGHAWLRVMHDRIPAVRHTCDVVLQQIKVQTRKTACPSDEHGSTVLLSV